MTSLVQEQQTTPREQPELSDEEVLPWLKDLPETTKISSRAALERAVKVLFGPKFMIQRTAKSLPFNKQRLNIKTQVDGKTVFTGTLEEIGKKIDDEIMEFVKVKSYKDMNQMILSISGKNLSTGRAVWNAMMMYPDRRNAVQQMRSAILRDKNRSSPPSDSLDSLRQT